MRILYYLHHNVNIPIEYTSYICSNVNIQYYINKKNEYEI